MAPARKRRRLPTLIDRGIGLLEVILPHGSADDPISTLPEGQRDTAGFWFPSGYTRPGDIFTPVAEPENSGVGAGATNQFATYQDLWQFMRDSITVCNEAFNDIGLGGQVFVGGRISRKSQSQAQSQCAAMHSNIPSINPIGSSVYVSVLAGM